MSQSETTNLIRAWDTENVAAPGDESLGSSVGSPTAQGDISRAQDKIPMEDLQPGVLAGSWIIGNGYLYSGQGSNVAGMAPADYPYFAGATYANRATAPFRVTPAGAAIMSNATITGGSLSVGLLPGLAGDENLAGYWAFDEGSGSTAIDGSRNGNNGAISNATYTTGKVGKALSFNGTTSYIQVTDASAIQNIWDGGGALSVWIKPTSDGEADQGNIFNKDKWYLRVKNQSGSVVDVQFACFYTPTAGLWSVSNIPTGQWTHIIVVHNSDSASNDPTIYVNGVSATVTEVTTPSGTRTTDVGNNLFIGNNDATALTTFDGVIDEPRLYSTSLTAAQAQALYLNPAGNNTTIIGPGQISTTSLSAISAELGSAVISTTGYLRSGQTAYGTGTGWWIGYDSGAPKLSIGVGTTGLTFDGTTAKLNGSEIATVQDRAESLYNETVFIGSFDDGLSTATDASYSINRTLLNTCFTCGTNNTGAAVLYSSYFGMKPDGSQLAWNSGTSFEFSMNVEMNGTFDSADITNYFGVLNYSASGFTGTTSTGKHYVFVINNNKLYASCANGTTQTLSSEITGITLTDKHFYRIVYTVGTNIKFYVDDVLKATLSTNMPTGTTSSTDSPALVARIQKTASSSKQWQMLINNNYSIVWVP